jgi:tetratricopeptide (TPR) repeat protein
MQITPGPIIPGIKTKTAKRAIYIMIVILALLTLLGGIGYLLLNKGNVQINNKKIETRQEILDNYLNPASSGQKDGKDLSFEERQALYKSSSEKLAEYIKNNSRDTGALEDLAASYYNLGKYNEAIVTYQKLISLEPDKALNYTNIAHAYLANKNDELAIQNYKKSIEMDTKIEINYIVLSVIYQSQGKVEDAKTILNKGLAENPESETLNKNLEGLK